MVVRRPPTLLERQAAFLDTLTLLLQAVPPTTNPEVLPALIRASAMLVVGATLESTAPQPMTSAREMRAEEEEEE